MLENGGGGKDQKWKCQDFSDLRQQQQNCATLATANRKHICAAKKSQNWCELGFNGIAMFHSITANQRQYMANRQLRTSFNKGHMPCKMPIYTCG